MPELIRRSVPTASLTAVALAAVALAVMVWQLVADGPLVELDWRVHVWADIHLPTGAARGVLDVFTNVTGQRLYTLPVLFAAAWWASRTRGDRKPLIATVVGLGTVFVLGYGLKLGLGRTFPATGMDALHAGGQAFPSGHTANATFTWIFVVILLFGAGGRRPDPAALRRWLPLGALVALTTGALMTILDYHWLSDVVAGWLVGIIALTAAIVTLTAPLPTWLPAGRERSR